jgi:3-oxoacyl-[acyl-carrier-protein] synthase II
MDPRRRVVVTGMAGLSPLGSGWGPVGKALRDGKSGIARIDAWNDIEGLSTRIGGRVDFSTPEAWPRKKTRTMGRVALLATRASELALADAGLLGDPVLGSGRVGIAYGSASGSKDALDRYSSALHTRKRLQGIAASDYHKLSGHTCSANLAQFFEVRGRQIATPSACVAGAQALGYAYEAIRFGRQDAMIAGGAEELSVKDVAVFDIMRASSKRNDDPQRASRPFDADRDGVVLSEGAATLILEELGHARARGVEPLAEIIGFGTNSDGAHMTRPDSVGMQGAMELALADAELQPDQIDWINAHGTATDQGDVAESQAIGRLFGCDVPTSSLKGHFGHALGACGPLETWLGIGMLREGWVAPTLNLERIDERCGALDYVRGTPRSLAVEHMITNNFAFGGVNASLVVRRWGNAE